MVLRSILAAGAATIALAGAAHAQETTTSVRGTVETDAGAPLANAEVVVTDTRTGQSRTVTTDSDGRFRVTNLPAGGPYSVTARETGYLGERVDDLTFFVGDTANLTFSLEDLAAGVADEIVVVGTRQVLGTVAPGPSVTFTAEDLAELPTTSRDIKDIIKLDPRVYIDETFGDGVYCVGSSNRSNSLTVDGYNLNDNFGLNGNGYPTQRLPFPYDVAEQVSVEIAPFDVQYGGFTGCNINVVSRTGTDDFQGRLVFDFTNGDLQGNSIEGDSFENPDIDEYSYGGYLSGPILKERLYFTLGYEKFTGGDTSNTSFAGSGFPNEIDSITATDVSRVQQILADVYGFEAGNVPAGLDVDDERFFGKLDAYLTDQHRLELSGQHTTGNSISIQNTSANFGELGLSSNWYDRSEELTVVSGRLFSEWTDSFSTEARVSYQDRETGQNSLGDGDFAQLEIQTDAGGSIFVGPDVFRHANQLMQEAWNAKLAANYTTGDHFFTVGYEYDRNEVFNLFVSSSEGDVVFESIEDLAAQQPASIFYSNTGSNDATDGAADFATDKHTIYAQDVWTVNNALEVTGGVRIDAYAVEDKPGYNPAFQARYGIRNDDTLEGKTLVMPRIAFDYVANNGVSFTGGVGLFSGGEPGVWVSNNYTNNGVLLGSAFSDDPDVLAGFDGFNIPQALLDANTTAVNNADGYVNALDPNYEIPSVLRFSFGAKYIADFQNFLGGGWEFGADVLYGITYNPNEWQALNMATVGQAPDGRPIYAGIDRLDPDCAGLTYRPGTEFDYGDCDSRVGGSGDGDFLLTNSDEEPKQLVLSGYVQNEWELDTVTLGGFLGYAFTDAEDVNPGTSSRAISNFENFAVYDYNNSRAATSNYAIPHRFTGRFDVAQEWAPGWTTRLGLAGQLNAGRPYSYTFDAGRAGDGFPNGLNFFGDTDASADRGLVYVPISSGDPNLDVANSDPQALADYLAFFSDDKFDDYRGGVAPRNEFNSDWWGKIDLRLSQTIPLPAMLGNDRLRLLVDVDNLTNLIDDDWGLYREYGFPYRVQTVGAELTENGYAIQSFDVNDQFVNRGISTWQVQFGARYDF
ncbi:TonB-dependent receptor [Parvularcula oceani]|uniref:TonB-dependent receptor n=1 Tax=Parvularcula oceani TaxID=1247963 RepID=UPI00068BF938|nr:carboxypeptidase regulatory-like domain-containing protein [Parvularcula oceani]